MAKPNNTNSFQEGVDKSPLGATVLAPIQRLRKNLAFTLAEVLITLGIIGIVAAMVIPSLMVGIQKIEIQSRLSKSYAVLANAMKLSAEDNGSPESWPTGAQMEVYSYWETYLKPYLNGAKLCETSIKCGYAKSTWTGYNWTLKTSSSRILIQLVDGTAVFIPKNSTNAAGNPQYVSTFVVDVNGPKKPNAYCKDVFEFKRGTQEGITPTGCTKKLRDNNWRFPKDYSWW